MSRWMRVKALFKRRQLDRDLEEELAFHLAMREAKNRARDIEGVEARYAARRQFGNVTRIKEACREAWSFVSLMCCTALVPTIRLRSSACRCFY